VARQKKGTFPAKNCTNFIFSRARKNETDLKNKAKVGQILPE